MASVQGPTQICNLALGKLGPASGFLAALDTDQTVAAQACRRVYEPMRDEVTEIFPWRFARRRALLPADTNVPAWGYTAQFVLPSDFLRLLSMMNTAEDYELEGGVLMSNDAAPLYIRYLARVTDTSQFSPTFVSALACRIAIEICETITKSTTKKQGLAQEYSALLKQAKHVENFGATSDKPQDGDWLLSRL